MNRRIMMGLLYLVAAVTAGCLERQCGSTADCDGQSICVRGACAASTDPDRGAAPDASPEPPDANGMGRADVDPLPDADPEMGPDAEPDMGLDSEPNMGSDSEPEPDPPAGPCQWDTHEWDRCQLVD